MPLVTLQGIQCVRDGALNVVQHHSLKTHHNDWSECYLHVVIQAGWGDFLREWDECSGLKAEGHSSLAKGKVEYGGENTRQLADTCSEGSLILSHFKILTYKKKI